MTDLLVAPGLPISDKSSDAVVEHTATVKVDGKRRNVPIQWLRAVAAISVMLYHSGGYQATVLKDHRFEIFGSPFGYMGVALFFAISGYLMSIAVRVQKPAVFLAHRVIRIYPTYVLIALLTYWITEQFLPVKPNYDWKWLMLLPVFKLKQPFISVEWSLIFEISFYACLYLVAVLGLSNRIGRVALVWIAGIVVTEFVWPDPGQVLVFPIYRLLFISTSLPMAGGLLIPYAMKWKIPALPLLLAGIGLWGLYPFSNDYYDTCRWIFGCSSILIVWSAVAFADHPRFANPGLFGRALSRMGDYSYALYLVHAPILHMTYDNTNIPNHFALWAGTILLTLAVSVAVGRFDLWFYKHAKAAVGRVPLAWIRPFSLTYLAWFLVMATIASSLYAVHDYRMVRLERLATRMLAAHPIASPEDALAAGEAVGLAPSPAMRGSLDRVDWRPLGEKSGLLTVDLWGADLDTRKKPVGIMLFRGNQLWKAELPNFVRDDIRSMFQVKAKSGYFEQVVEACASERMIAVIVGEQGRFLVLPETKPQGKCPAATLPP